MKKIKVESILLDNQAFQLNSHPEGSCLQVQLTASVCRAGDSSSSESLWSALNWSAALRPVVRGWVHYVCVVYFLFSHVFYLPSYHISSVIPLIYLQTFIFTTQRPLIAYIYIYINIYRINYQYSFCFKKEFKIQLNGNFFLVTQRCNFLLVLDILLWNY